MDYLDYDLLIEDNLTIKASSKDDSIEGKLQLDNDNKKEIEYAVTKLEDTNSRIEKDWLKNVGTKLANALFTQEIRNHFYDVKSKAHNKGIRVRLNIKSPEISRYPWEALFDNGRYMAVELETPLTRFIPNVAPTKKTFDKPVKILMIAANPSDPKLPAINVEREIEVITESLQNGIDNGIIKLDVERRGNVRRIMDQLNNENYNIIHFIGHGVFKDGLGYLALEDNTGGLDIANHERIGDIFLNEKSLGLIVLNACQGAATSTSKAFTGLAPELIRRGIPSIIAMRYSITNQMAHHFSREFYKNLPRIPFDENLQRVRQSILVNQLADPREFTAPILFMNAPDGMIFQPANEEAQTLIVKPALELKLKELREQYNELIGGSEVIDVKDFWLLIMDIYKEYKRDLDRKALKRIEETQIRVPVLIRKYNEKQRSGLGEGATEVEQTIISNFKLIREAIE